MIFQSEIIHPLICPHTGQLNLSDAFATWNHAEHHLWQLLKYIQFVFHHPVASINSTATKVLNQEAIDLIRLNKIAEFSDRVKECVRISKDKIYDDPPTDDKHYITFSMFDEDVHRHILENIKYKSSNKPTSPLPSGLSWVNEGEYKPLSK